MKNQKNIKLIIMAVIFIGIAGISYALFFRRDFTHIGDREIEARRELTTIVDLILKQDSLDVDLVKIKYHPTGVLKNVYGVVRLCHPNGHNLNVLELPDPPKFHSSIIRNKADISNFFSGSACLSPGEVRIYAVFPTQDKRIMGWYMNLNKIMGSFAPQ